MRICPIFTDLVTYDIMQRVKTAHFTYCSGPISSLDSFSDDLLATSALILCGCCGVIDLTTPSLQVKEVSHVDLSFEYAHTEAHKHSTHTRTQHTQYLHAHIHEQQARTHTHKHTHTFTHAQTTEYLHWTRNMNCCRSVSW